MATRKEILRDRRPRGRGQQPRQGVLPARRSHQAGPGPLLPRGGRRRAGRRPRPADGAQALRRRRREGAVLPEARPGQPARLDAGRDADVPLRSHGRRAGRGRGGRARVGREPGLPGPQPAPRPRRGPGPPGRAAHRPGPGAGRAVVATCARSPWSAARRSRRWASSAGRRRPARAASTSTFASSRAGRTRRSGGRRSRWRGTWLSPPRTGRPQCRTTGIPPDTSSTTATPAASSTTSRSPLDEPDTTSRAPPPSRFCDGPDPTIGRQPAQKPDLALL